MWEFSKKLKQHFQISGKKRDHSITSDGNISESHSLSLGIPSPLNDYN